MAFHQLNTAHDHELKCDPEPFKDLAEGLKSCEIRKDDRGYSVGQILWLRETKYDAQTPQGLHHSFGSIYTGRNLYMRITHVQRGYGLQEGHCCLSVIPVEKIGIWIHDCRL